MRRSICQLAVVCFILQLPLLALAKDVYVSKNCGDSNPGTKAQPLATVESTVEAMQRAGSGTMWISPGDYYLEPGIGFDEKHGGTAEQPLVIRGIEPGKTRLSGSRVVKVSGEGAIDVSFDVPATVPGNIVRLAAFIGKN